MARSCAKHLPSDPPAPTVLYVLPSEYFIALSSPETAWSPWPFEPPQIASTPRLPNGPMSLGRSRQKEAVSQLGVISRDTACSLWQDQVLNERRRRKRSGVRSRLKDHWGPFCPQKKKKKKAEKKKGKTQRLLCKTAPLVNRIWGGKKEKNCILLSEATWSNKRIAFAHLRMECEAPFRCSDRI